MITAVFNPPNCLAIIEDISGGEPPVAMGSALIVSTRSCIAVTCGYDFDVEFILGDVEEVNPGGHFDFRGTIATPNLVLVIRTVALETILQGPVSRVDTTVQVWVRETDDAQKVVVGVE